MGLLSLILPAIPSLVQLVEKLFGAGTGATKLDTVVQMIKQLIPNIKLPPGVTDGSITDDQIKGAIESVLSNLKASGQINSPLPTAAPLGTDLYIVHGPLTKINL